MAALLDALRSRARQRDLNAIDLIAEAARAAAAGKSYDAGAVETAMREQGMSIEQFEDAVGKARQRAVWLQQFDGLNATTGRIAKLEAAITSEEDKFEQQRLAAAAKIEKIAEELRVEKAARDAGERARHQLLNPANVPGTVGEQFRDAIAARDAARGEVEKISRELRDVGDQLDVQTSLAGQFADEGKRLLTDHHIAARRQEKLDGYRERCESLTRRIKEIEKTLAAAERDFAAAEQAVKKLEIEALKA